MSEGLTDGTPEDLLVVLNPGVEDHWKKASNLAKAGIPTMALNAPFNIK
jgi:hypothetical protein